MSAAGKTDTDSLSVDASSAAQCRGTERRRAFSHPRARCRRSPASMRTARRSAGRSPRARRHTLGRPRTPALRRTPGARPRTLRRRCPGKALWAAAQRRGRSIVPFHAHGARCCCGTCAGCATVVRAAVDRAVPWIESTQRLDRRRIAETAEGRSIVPFVLSAAHSMESLAPSAHRIRAEQS